MLTYLSSVNIILSLCDHVLILCSFSLRRVSRAELIPYVVSSSRSDLLRFIIVPRELAQHLLDSALQKDWMFQWYVRCFVLALMGICSRNRLLLVLRPPFWLGFSHLSCSLGPITCRMIRSSSESFNRRGLDQLDLNKASFNVICFNC